MRNILETAVILLGTLGWWGFVYPELCLLESDQEAEYVCEAYCDDEEKDSTGQAGDDAQAESAESGSSTQQPETDPCRQIRIKSKIAEYICQVRENTAAEKEIENDKQKRPHWGF